MCFCFCCGVRAVSVPETKWRWYGMAGHFICGDKCLHHLCTKVGNYLVSTVGDYRPKEGAEPEQIGCDRLYETMVFKLAGGECDCGCGLPVIVPSEIDYLPANDAPTADKNHIKLCRKIARK